MSLLDKSRWAIAVAVAARIDDSCSTSAEQTKYQGSKSEILSD
ncbi:hypothetical protein ACN26Y_18485 [Micromonospora sp. WMMD558]|nr:hypothetical protein [Micromonospora sp. WMMC415]